VDPVSNLERVLNDARTLIDAVSANDLTKSTPCSSWDVRALIEHMTGVVTNFSRAFGGAQLTPPPLPGSSGAADDNLAAAYRPAVDALLAAVRAPGALDQTIKLPFGEMPGQNAIGIVLADQMIHSWDLAKAVGRPFAMDESMASATLAGLHGLLGSNPNARGEGRAFAEEVPCPESAPAQDRLLAFSGRQP
jgi:uncharacterized protein (TIGR03086 family)